ncbi:RBBP9/YdeN family alpha/beta hydrolase [Rhizobium alvei]|uniref:Alpha/beta hydrolase n=1 Tax=Rhizobium alvei TaxID=1132659 RepID=A0ABT8YRD8_9HYPH|nr:alpha/beta hydrolase [Rhizobium alvei]MDO6966298.1 alpha/beta hydrolase [Rhizobium alvei]
MPTRLLVPGFQGSGPGHWQYCWEKDDPDSIRVNQQDWDRPNRAQWLDRLIESLKSHPGATLVAHSLGAVLVAELATHPARHLVGAALLVAPCNLSLANQLHPGKIEFGPMPEARLPFPTVLVASHNDPYMRFDDAERYATLWGSDLKDIGHAGHINIASGFGRWSEGPVLASSLEQRTRKGSSLSISAPLANAASLPVAATGRMCR